MSCVCLPSIFKKVDNPPLPSRARRIDPVSSTVTGRPPRISKEVRYETISLACGQPEEFGVLFRDVWTCESLARCILDRHPELGTFDASTAWRYLHGAAVRPHHEQMWLHSPDPEFRLKVAAICTLYVCVPTGSVVLCVDEKTGMQALGRPYPVRPAGPHRSRRKDSDYIRHGTRALIAAFNPHTGEVFGRIGATRTADDLMAFMEELAIQHPTGDVHIGLGHRNGVIHPHDHVHVVAHHRIPSHFCREIAGEVL